MSRSVIRRVGIALGVIGALLALGSVVGSMLATGVFAILIWLVPECAGLVLVVVGLHAWIDG